LKKPRIEITTAQFHPEELLWSDEKDELILKKLIEVCKGGRNG